MTKRSWFCVCGDALHRLCCEAQSRTGVILHVVIELSSFRSQPVTPSQPCIHIRSLTSGSVNKFITEVPKYHADRPPYIPATAHSRCRSSSLPPKYCPRSRDSRQ